VINELLPMVDCIPVMEAALAELARGQAEVPVRLVLDAGPGVGAVALMPAELRGSRALGYKVVTVFPGARERGEPAHQAVVALLDPDTGRILAFLDGTSITAIRTAAVSGLATRLLAREEAGDLAILGSGAQAVTHLEAMRTVRRLRSVRVWSRSREGATRFAEREGRRTGLTIEVCGTSRKAVLGADLICTTTAAREPVLEGAWIAPGAHVNAVGACIPAARELDTAAVVRARLFVDSRESAQSEAGDFLIPRAEGALGDEHIAGELGEVVIGRVPGRRSPEEITLFKSLGLAVEDLAAAQAVYRRAVEAGAGTQVELVLPRGGSAPTTP
jgi:ornithine cyclodeaminase